MCRVIFHAFVVIRWLFFKINFFKQFFQAHYHMGLVARKPVFRGLRTTQAQTSLRICAVWSAPLLFVFCKEQYLSLLQAKLKFSSQSLYLRRLIWNTLCWKPRRQVFSRRGPYQSVKWFGSTSRLTLEASTMNPDQTAPKGAQGVWSPGPYCLQ